MNKSLIILLFLFLTGCTAPQVKVDYSLYESTLVFQEAKPIETKILELINEHRASIGLNRLEYMQLIKSVSRAHNIDMIKANQISHNGFVERSGYLIYKTNGTRVGENLAYNYNSAESVVSAWLKSPLHRKNIEGDYTYFDVSVEENKDGKPYITNMFLKK